MPENTTARDFQDVCVLGFLKHFHISPDEFQNLFFYGRGEIASSDTQITGAELRTLLRIDDECTPEIREGQTGNYMAFSAEMSEEQVSQLLTLRGDTLTSERILEILAEEDQMLQAQAAALIAAANVDNAGVHDYTRDELMAMENKDFIFACLEMMSGHRVFNGYTFLLLSHNPFSSAFLSIHDSEEQQVSHHCPSGPGYGGAEAPEGKTE